jgi:fumarylacetoacetase
MTWLDLAPDDPFGIHNLPYCSFGKGCFVWPGVRVGQRLLNLYGLETDGHLDANGSFTAGGATLNHFLAQGRRTWTAVRDRLTELLTEPRYRPDVERYFFDLTDDVRLNLPFEVPDYVDFYSSREHATNLGRLLRPGQPPLLPNWKHMPIGYHGRAGSVVVSGTPVRRPCGQRRPANEGALPTFGPSERLDIEAEVGFVGGWSEPDVPVAPDRFAEHVLGFVLVNDWSARDIQAWEYQPLGPFLGKAFATSISPYVVPLDALAAARVPAPPQDPPVLAHLRDDRVGYDIRLEVRWNGTLVSRPPYRTLYWTPAQQLAHLTAGGIEVRAGDLYASGTVSGPRRDETGSFIELTWNGTEPVTLADGSTRTFLEDGDTVTITATAPGPDGSMIGFGEVTGTIVRGQVVASG